MFERVEFILQWKNQAAFSTLIILVALFRALRILGRLLPTGFKGFGAVWLGRVSGLYVDIFYFQ